MPELPDAVIHRRTLDDAALGHEIAGLHVGDTFILDDTTPEELRHTLVGTCLTETARHGKHVLMRHTGGGWLGWHFGMTGRPHVYEGEDDRFDGDGPHHAYGHFRLDFADGWHAALVCPRKLARVTLADAPEAFIQKKGLGPDALGLGFDAFRACFDGRRGTVKGALLNQKILAGLGNIYADEALFQTRLHPSETVDTFDEATWRNLHEAIQTVLRAAIDAGANPTRLDGERFMLPHRYGDERCPRHDEPFETLEVAGRTAYVCPTCQPAP